MATRPVLVVVFAPENFLFWRRHPFSSSFLRRNLHFLVTTPVLVVVLRPKMLFFGDDTLSRRRFEAENLLFWRRDHFSSSFLCRKVHFLATKPFLVVIFVRETPLFGDENTSRRHFEPGNATFWRRDHFSSSFLYGKLHFLATRLFLVVVFAPETSFFGDETLSRRRFETENAIFWRRHPFSSSFCGGKLTFLATRPFLVVILWRKTSFFGDETRSRRRFETENAIFWRRHPFSSSFLCGNLHFLATRPFLVVAFGRRTHFFWRRHPFSSSFCGGKLTFLATTPLLVVILWRKTSFFGDETRSRRRFETENAIFWRRHPFSSSFLCVNKYTNSCFSAFDCL
ncbi:hypothetical protein NST54_16805 [Caldifermentibacillus hisashii]|uniref:hypothetical protein n=1 Tax=Caldifermentibacillus hisashii TaxID=996558 RepID=UPI0034D46C88